MYCIMCLTVACFTYICMLYIRMLYTYIYPSFSSNICKLSAYLTDNFFCLHFTNKKPNYDLQWGVNINSKLPVRCGKQLQ